MVAPSFEIVALPYRMSEVRAGGTLVSSRFSRRRMDGRGPERGRTLASTMSLSIPRGPRVVATTLATLMQAEMLLSS